MGQPDDPSDFHYDVYRRNIRLSQHLGYPTGLIVDQEIADGGIVLGDTPGMGIIVDEAAVEAVATSSALPPVGGPNVRPDRAGLRLVPEPRATAKVGAGSASKHPR